ncbi:hypothetical protein ACJX0J_012656, partial [Zea mays]
MALTLIAGLPSEKKYLLKDRAAYHVLFGLANEQGTLFLLGFFPCILKYIINAPYKPKKG